VPGDGTLTFSVRVELVDGTFLEARGHMAIDEVGGAPQLRRVGDPEVRYGGASFDRLRQEARKFGYGLGNQDTVWADVVCAGSLGFLCPRQEAAAIAGRMVDAQLPDLVRRTVAQRLDEALGTVGRSLGELMRRSWSPLRERPDVKWTTTLAAPPSISKEGIVLRLCMRSHIPPPQVDASIRGPVLHAEPALRATALRPDKGAVIRVRMDVNALNAILFVLWQSGVLRDRAAGVTAALPAPVRALAFEWTGLEPLLPPVVSEPEPDRSGMLPVVLGALRMGRWDRRDVLAHATAEVSLKSGTGPWTLSARARTLATNCAERVGSGTRLTPCLSDLVPIVKDTLEREPVEQTFAEADLLARLPELTFSALTLQLRNARASVEGPPAALVLEVDAEIVGIGGP